MTKCLKYFSRFFRKKTKKTLPIDTKELILEKELNAFINLELYNISHTYINKYGIDNIKCKLIQQYYWILNNKIDNKDQYIPLDEWHMRFN